MSRYIDADAILNEKGNSFKFGDETYYHESIIQNAPTVDAVHVVHGEWKLIESELPWIEYRCSECGTYSKYATHYCPNCGARMRGEHDEQADC